ncbi:histidine phosphatase family protein [Leadbetterella sp. DM7]|uniref:SixA phosphatase family protein n=1 Tax=Leadbetterella sp. DM7 TaxID=3235085 RepID=UPI00349EB9D7
MKKDLFIVRHATAEDIGNLRVVRDFDRELISKGVMEAAKAGRYLSEYFPGIEAIYSSGAARALSTATYMAEQLRFDTEKIEICDALYGSGPRGYLEVLNRIPAGTNSAMIVGHNPDVTYFVDYLTGDDTGGSMKKATVIHLQFEDLEWNEISHKLGHFVKRIDKLDLT